MKSDRTTGTRRGAVAAAVAAVLVLAVAPLGVAVVGAGAGFLPSGPDAAVAPQDAGVNGFDVVEPVVTSEAPKADDAVRTLADWAWTDGGSKKPPRPSPKG